MHLEIDAGPQRSPSACSETLKTMMAPARVYTHCHAAGDVVLTDNWSVWHSTRVFCFDISEHADGERRGPASVCWYLTAHPTETFPTPTLRFDLAPRRSPSACPEKASKNRSVWHSTTGGLAADDRRVMHLSAWDGTRWPAAS